MRGMPFNTEKIITTGPDGIEYQDTFWDDMMIPAGSLFSGGGVAPTSISYKNTYIYGFNVDDQLQFATQIPHRWKVGTDLHLHIHWTPHTRGAAESGHTVNWRIDISAVSIDGVFPDATTYVLTDTCDGVDHKHRLVEATVDISGLTLSFSGMLLGKVYRITGDSWAGTNANAPALLEVDLHYEIDRPGSRQEYIK